MLFGSEAAKGISITKRLKAAKAGGQKMFFLSHLPNQSYIKYKTNQYKEKQKTKSIK